MTNFPENVRRGIRGFTSIGAYELGYVFCRKCGEWSKLEDRTKTYLTGSGAVACIDCKRKVSRVPKGAAYRRRLREIRGVKEIE